MSSRKKKITRRTSRNPREQNIERKSFVFSLQNTQTHPETKVWIYFLFSYFHFCKTQTTHTEHQKGFKTFLVYGFKHTNPSRRRSKFRLYSIQPNGEKSSEKSINTASISSIFFSSSFILFPSFLFYCDLIFVFVWINFY